MKLRKSVKKFAILILTLVFLTDIPLFLISDSFPSLLNRSKAAVTGTLYPTNNGSVAGTGWLNKAGTQCTVNGTNCYTEVNETTSDDNATYIQKGTQTNLDITFDLNLTTIPDNSTITAVSVTFICQKGTNPGQNTTAAGIYRLNSGTVQVGSTQTCGKTNWTSFTQDFTGLSITKSGSTDFEVGVRGVANQQLWVTTINAVITYSPPTITISNGTSSASGTYSPGSGIADLTSFRFQTNTGTDSITALTVTLTGTNSYQGLSEVRITNDAGSITYFSAVNNPSNNVINFSGGTPITATSSLIQYKIRITPKSHVDQPSPPGALYAIGGTITSWTGDYVQDGVHTLTGAYTLDNESPNGATNTSGDAGSEHVDLFWTNSSSADLSATVILRWEGESVGSEVPQEGDVDITVGSVLGDAIVACVRNSEISFTESSGTDGQGTGGCSATPLVNDQPYSYKIFQQDSRGNYDVGVTFGGSPFTPVGAVVSVEITTNGVVNYGFVGNAQSKSSIDVSATQNINNNGNVDIELDIRTSNATEGITWTLGSDAGEDIFVHEFSTNSGDTWTKFTTPNSYQAFLNYLAPDSGQDFDFRITVPTISSDHEQKYINVTILATEI